MSGRLALGVALKDAGWHPGAWREPTADPGGLFTGAYWHRLARTAEDAGVDLLTLEDSFGLQVDGPFDALDPATTSAVRGRLDAVLLANHLAPRTSTIGLVPTVLTAATEPFHVATAIATLDHVSGGRAGLRPVAVVRQHEADQQGRWAEPLLLAQLATPAGQAALAERFDEAADALEVARRLWDSWQDDAVIRDVATGRYVDRERLHRADFTGPRFSVRGPSITPRPPQGQPVVAVLAHQRIPYLLAARQADVVFIAPHDDADLDRITREVRDAERTVGRSGQPLQIWVDAVVLVDDDAASALTRLDEQAGGALETDALLLADAADAIAARLLHWRSQGVDGVRLRPARLPLDLDRIAAEVVPALERAGVLPAPPSGDLRSRLGLPRAGNRFTGEPPFTTTSPAAAPEEEPAR